MEVFQQLGDEIWGEWRRRNFRYDDFAEFACEALGRRPPSREVSSADVLRWVATTPSLPPQFDLSARFGQPPITVYRRDAIHIDVLFWTSSTTTIHQHAFDGAFHVLDGSSLHCEYEFAERERLCAWVKLGSLRRASYERLARGDVRPIRAGQSFIHSLFHLDNPSVSVVVRANENPLAGPQFNYFPPGLAIDPFFQEPAFERRRQVLQLLLQLDDGQAEGWFEEVIGRANEVEALRWADHLATLTELAGAAGETAAALVERAYRALPRLEGVLREAGRQRARTLHVSQLRASVKDPHHRWFLALVLNLDRRRDIFRAVAERYPGERPEDKVCGWLTELARPLPDGGSLLGFEVSEAALEAVGLLLRGATPGDVIEGLRAKFGGRASDIGAEQLRDFLEGLREEPIFDVLMRHD